MSNRFKIAVTFASFVVFGVVSYIIWNSIDLKIKEPSDLLVGESVVVEDSDVEFISQNDNSEEVQMYTLESLRIENVKIYSDEIYGFTITYPDRFGLVTSVDPYGSESLYIIKYENEDNNISYGIYDSRFNKMLWRETVLKGECSEMRKMDLRFEYSDSELCIGFREGIYDTDKQEITHLRQIVSFLEDGVFIPSHGLFTTIVGDKEVLNIFSPKGFFFFGETEGYEGCSVPLITTDKDYETPFKNGLVRRFGCKPKIVFSPFDDSMVVKTKYQGMNSSGDAFFVIGKDFYYDIYPLLLGGVASNDIGNKSKYYAGIVDIIGDIVFLESGNVQFSILEDTLHYKSGKYEFDVKMGTMSRVREGSGKDPSEHTVYLNDVIGTPNVRCLLPELKVGDKSESVSLLQYVLSKYTLYYSGEITGNYDTLTSEAVAKYQINESVALFGEGILDTTSARSFTLQYIEKYFPECKGATNSFVKTSDGQTIVMKPIQGEVYNSGDYLVIDWAPEEPGVSDIILQDANYNNNEEVLYAMKVYGYPLNVSGFFKTKISNYTPSGKYRILLRRQDGSVFYSDNFTVVRE